MIFSPEEPRIGGFTVLVEDNFIYLWGFHENHLVLASVPASFPHIRQEYRFWNGFGYVENIKHAKPVISGIQQGAIIKSSLFGKERPWVVVGCTCWVDNQVMVGAARSLEGPWEVSHVVNATSLTVPGNLYCMYPHSWIFDAGNGELAVSWSEHWPGNVIMARLRFAKGKSSI